MNKSMLSWCYRKRLLAGLLPLDVDQEVRPIFKEVWIGELDPGRLPRLVKIVLVELTHKRAVLVMLKE